MKTGMIGIASAIACSVGGLGNTAHAQDTYAFTLSQSKSSFEAQLRIAAPVSGTFIGNYDAEDNPNGTRTILGQFGLCTGSQNQAIGYTGVGEALGNPTTSDPTGTFVLQIDTVNERAVLHSLAVDLLGGGKPAIATEAIIGYEAFRTCNPTGIFPSLPFPLPLEDAVITRLTAVQTCAPSVGTIKNLSPGEYSVFVLTTVRVDPGVTFNGEEQDTAPVDVPVTVFGTVRLGDVAATAQLSMSLRFEQEIEGPIIAADGLPVDLPNPLGGTVHLLLDMTLETVEITMDSVTNMQAAGSVTTTPCRADWNHDEVVNSQDFFDFLTSFFGAAADFNCSGTTNSQDFFDFLAMFFEGC